MKIKTSELKGAALDWAVAKCEGAEFHHIGDNLCVHWGGTFDVRLQDYTPSTNWSQGGPIIEREIAKDMRLSGGQTHGRACYSHYDRIGEYEAHIAIGDTVLVAAMRCYVASKLGDEVEIPEELV